MAPLSRILSEAAKDAEMELKTKALLEALSRPEIDVFTGKSVLARAEQDYLSLASHVYYIQKQDGNKRRAYTEELANPNEFLYSEMVVHGPDNPSSFLKEAVVTNASSDVLNAELLRYVKKRHTKVHDAFGDWYNGKSSKSEAMHRYVKAYEPCIIGKFYETFAQKYSAEILQQQYALVLWALTGFNRYAQAAGLHINYARLGRRTVSNALDVAFENEGGIIRALQWWVSGDRTQDVSAALEKSKARVKGAKYAAGRSKAIDPYIDWEIAAKAVIGLRMASTDSNKSARQLQYGKDLRPDEKAQFIRDYIDAENISKNAVTSETVRELKELCDEVSQYVSEYPMFNTEKVNDIIMTLSRSDFMRASNRQVEYLRRVLMDAKLHAENKSKETVGGDLFDMDAFFGSEDYGEE